MNVSAQYCLRVVHRSVLNCFGFYVYVILSQSIGSIVNLLEFSVQYFRHQLPEIVDVPTQNVHRTYTCFAQYATQYLPLSSSAVFLRILDSNLTLRVEISGVTKIIDSRYPHYSRGLYRILSYLRSQRQRLPTHFPRRLQSEVCFEHLVLCLRFECGHVQPGNRRQKLRQLALRSFPHGGRFTILKSKFSESVSGFIFDIHTL